MWMKEVRGKRPIDLYDNFLPSLVDVVNGLQDLLFMKIEEEMGDKHP